MYKAVIKYDPNHNVFKWIKKRNIKSGSMPLPIPLADKAGGKKGKPIPYDNDDLTRLLKLNGNNMYVFKVVTRIGGFLFNSARNKHLLSWLGKILGKANWWKGNYVPYPMPKGKKALAEKIYMVGNTITIDKDKGRWVHVTAGIGQLCQVDIVTGNVYKSNAYWYVPAGWIEKSLTRKV